MCPTSEVHLNLRPGGQESANPKQVPNTGASEINPANNVDERVALPIPQPSPPALQSTLTAPLFFLVNFMMDRTWSRSNRSAQEKSME